MRAMSSTHPSRLSRRVRALSESATLKVSRRAAELKAAGRDIIDFGAGEPDFDSPAVAVEAAVAALRGGFTRYTVAAGIPALREKLAARYRDQNGAPWTLADVVVTVGGKAALFELALALFDEGDEVVLPSPYWVSFTEQIRFTGASPVLVPTSADDGFAIRAAPLLAACGPRTRAILVNSPSNPAGGVMSQDELGLLVAGAAERGLVVISDETYERFVYQGEPVSISSFASAYPETCVVVGSFSKTFAMTGWRLGWTAGPREIINAVATIQGHATSNVTSFAMKGALAALESAEPDVQRMIAEYSRRRELVVARLNAIEGVRCAPPGGAFYAFPDVSACYGPGCADSIAFAEWLLEEAGVAVVPGAAFGADDHVRISFACSTATIEAGMDRLAAALATRLVRS